MTENHCVSLRLAKKFKNIGWDKHTEFWWVGFVNNSAIGNERMFHQIIDKLELEEMTSGKREWIKVLYTYPAPLATELLEELPGEIEGELGYCYLTIEKRGQYKVYYSGTGCGIPVIKDLSLPDALAHLWLYLRKEKMI